MQYCHCHSNPLKQHSQKLTEQRARGQIEFFPCFIKKKVTIKPERDIIVYRSTFNSFK